ncbi:MAG: baeRF2 domain-containing protein [Pseudonocardia sp.]
MRLDDLRELAHTPGPFATVYLETSHDVPHAGHEVSLHWRSLRGELAGDGADEDTLRALDQQVEEIAEGPDRPVGRAYRVLVAARGDVLLDRELPAPTRGPLARWSPVPDLVDLVITRPEPVPTVLAVVDLTGADIYTDDGVREVAEPDFQLHEVRGGGMSQWRIQRRVAEHRKDNITDIGAAVQDEVTRTGARLLVLAGEVQSRTALYKSLGERAQRIAVQVEHGGRAEGTDDRRLAAEVRRARDRVIAERREAATGHFDQLRGHPDGLAVDGLAAALPAFRSALVQTLLLDADVRRDSPVWVGPAPEQVAGDERTLREVGVEPVGRVNADAALLRAAAGTGAEFFPIGGGRAGLVGRPVADGVAAVLRGPLPPG